MPAWAPIRQRRPTLMISLPPPDRVPMMDAPPPTSEPSPTTTPAEMRPSTIDGAQRAGVEVDETLVHDGRAGGQVGAEPDPVGVADAHPAREHVVDHPGELVDRVDGHRAAGPQPGADVLEALDLAGAVVGPHDVGQQAEDAVEVGLVGLDQTVGEQVEAQVGVIGVGRRVGQLADPDLDGHDLDIAVGVFPTRLASSPTSTADSRRTPGSSGSPRVGLRNQTSRTAPSGVTVASPTP